MTIETARRASLEFVCVLGQDVVALSVIMMDELGDAFLFLDATVYTIEATRMKQRRIVSGRWPK